MLELKVSTAKYQSTISMLESQLALLKGLAGEYADLQGQVSSFTSDGEIMEMAKVVAAGAVRVDNAIAAIQANIDTLRENVNTMESVGANISSIVEDAVSVVSSFS